MLKNDWVHLPTTEERQLVGKTIIFIGVAIIAFGLSYCMKTIQCSPITFRPYTTTANPARTIEPPINKF
jgi:hypothetical protein